MQNQNEYRLVEPFSAVLTDILLENRDELWKIHLNEVTKVKERRAIHCFPFTFVKGVDRSNENHIPSKRIGFFDETCTDSFDWVSIEFS